MTQTLARLHAAPSLYCPVLKSLTPAEMLALVFASPEPGMERARDAPVRLALKNEI